MLSEPRTLDRMVGDNKCDICGREFTGRGSLKSIIVKRKCDSESHIYCLKCYKNNPSEGE